MRHGCYYCAMVMQTIDRLGAEVPMKNIWEDPKAEDELTDATGRSVVPVLHYENDIGDGVWLPESSDIVALLKKEFG